MNDDVSVPGIGGDAGIASLERTSQAENTDLAEAKAKGLCHYFGKPCLHGHSGERYVLGNHCVQCRADYQALYKDDARQSLMRARLGVSTSKVRHLRISAGSTANIAEIKAKYMHLCGRPITLSLLVCRALQVLDEHLGKLDAAGSDRERAVLAMTTAP
jgi:hypothetical protein